MECKSNGFMVLASEVLRSSLQVGEYTKDCVKYNPSDESN